MTASNEPPHFTGLPLDCPDDYDAPPRKGWRDRTLHGVLVPADGHNRRPGWLAPAQAGGVMSSAELWSLVTRLALVLVGLALLGVWKLGEILWWVIR